MTIDKNTRRVGKNAQRKKRYFLDSFIFRREWLEKKK
jgi:hypothetical protein